MPGQVVRQTPRWSVLRFGLEHGLVALCLPGLEVAGAGRAMCDHNTRMAAVPGVSSTMQICGLFCWSALEEAAARQGAEGQARV